ncbi:hypothetical protein CR513_19464, partial [Mucuna pruriens]
MKTYHPKQLILESVEDRVRTWSTFKDQAQMTPFSKVELKLSMIGELKFFLGLQINNHKMEFISIKPNMSGSTTNDAPLDPQSRPSFK